jgi:hypothetical protein
MARAAARQQELSVNLPTLHPGQKVIYRNGTRYNAVRCGRRWGKTKALVTMAADAAARGKKVGLFTPEHKQLQEPYDELLGILSEVTRRANKTEGTIRTITGGIIDFWSLNDNELAGRGREYDLVMIDEAAFTKNGQMINIWKKSIAPTMLTRPNSEAWVFSTPNGNDTQNFFWKICHYEGTDSGLPQFTEHYAPTSTNPYIGADEIEKDRLTFHPKVFDQEYLAQWIDWGGDAFFTRDKLLVDGKPVPYPAICDSVFAVIDTAVKDRSEHDGTAVSYFSLSEHIGHRMVLLDWDIISIEGAMLETWLPTVYQRLDQFTTQFRCRFGSSGAFIEDKVSGTILLQQSRNRGWPAHPIDSKLTSAGKSERAISVSGYFTQGLLKISDYAFDKVTSFKGVTQNHWLSQLEAFRIGEKDGRADDLIDTAMYGLAIALGNPEGY